MIQIIAGDTGKGKTKDLIARANSAIATSKGSIVYLDKSSKHMYELNNRIRMIVAEEFPLENMSEFYGFICGIISQDHDIEQVYLDSFLKIAHLMKENIDDLEQLLEKLKVISDRYQVTLIVSISINESGLPESFKENVIVSL